MCLRIPEIPQHVVEQLRMTISRGGPVKVHQLTVDPQPGEDGHDFRRSNPLPRLMQLATQLFSTLHVKSLVPCRLHHQLQS